MPKVIPSLTSVSPQPSPKVAGGGDWWWILNCFTLRSVKLALRGSMAEVSLHVQQVSVLRSLVDDPAKLLPLLA